MDCEEITNQIKHLQEVNLHLLGIISDESKIDNFSTDYLDEINAELRALEKYNWILVRHIEIEYKIDLNSLEEEATDAEATPIAISPDGNKIAYQSGSDELVVKKLLTKEDIYKIKLPHPSTSISHNHPERLFFSEDSRQLMVNVWYINQSDNQRRTAFCFDTETGKEDENFDAQNVYKDFISHDYYLAGFALGSTLIRNYETDFLFQIRELFKEDDPILNERLQKFAMSPEGIAVIKTEKHLVAIDTNKKEVLDNRELEGDITEMEAIPGTTKFVMTHNIDTYWYDYSAKEIRTAYDGGVYPKFSVDENGQIFAGYRPFSELNIFDAVSNERIRLIELPKIEPNSIKVLANKKIAVIYKDGIVLVYGSKALKPILEVKASKQGGIGSFLTRFRKRK